jgi:hypothetical protein
VGAASFNHGIYQSAIDGAMPHLTSAEPFPQVHLNDLMLAGN